MRLRERFFVAAPIVFESVRQMADQAWGLPRNGQRTAIAPIEFCPVVDSMVYLCVRADHCEYPPFDVALPEMLAAGAVQEITEEQYWDACRLLSPPV